MAVDKKGYVHVAYNMHNMPWQYKISKKPYNISEMLFVGEAVDSADLFKVKALNKSGFVDSDNKFIRGTQVTYPAFFYDRNNNLYVSYRFAYKPDKKWKYRELSNAIARYDIKEKQWKLLGGAVDNKGLKIFAKDDKHVAYLPRLHFDYNNYMHVSYMWRKDGPGPDTAFPSYAYSSDGGNSFQDVSGEELNMPLSVHASRTNVDRGSQRYYAITDITTDDDGIPHIVMHQYKGKYRLMSYDRETQSWRKNDGFPGGAMALKYKNGQFYAFASGPTVYIKDQARNKKWRVISRQKDYCNPKVLDVPGKNEFYMFAKSSDLKTARVYKLEL